MPLRSEMVPPTSALHRMRSDARLDHAQADLAVVDQQALAAFQQAEQFGMGQFDAAVVAGRRIAVEREMPRMADDRTPALERADAQLGPLQIGQDGDRATEFLFQMANGLDGLRMRFALAMAHVDAKGVGARAQQLGQHLGAAAGGADGGQDLHLAAAWVECLHGLCYAPPS